MKTKLIILLISVITIFNSCKNDKKNTTDAKIDTASVRLNWIPTCSFAGEITGVKLFSKKNNINLKIKSGGIGLDPIKLVISGEDTFGVAGADLVIAANDKGADLVIIGLVCDNSPGVFLSKKEKHIENINDFNGARIGELPGGNMQYLYEVFLKKTNLVRNKDFTPIQIPFDLKNFITGDECDIRPVFIYDEPALLDLENIKYNIIEPKDIGIDFKGMCYFTERKTIKTNPILVQNFINTMAEGWTETIKNPNKSINYLKEFDNSISVEKELLGLTRGLSYFKGYNNKVLYSNIDSWNTMTTDMKELGFIKKDVQLDKLLDLSFVEKFHTK